MTISKEIEPLKEENFSVEIIGKINRHIGIGDLIENMFEIKLYKIKNMEKIINNIKKIEKNGMKNFFGPQRFGARKNNHLIGKYIIKRQWKKAEKIIGKPIKSVPKKMLKF